MKYLVGIFVFEDTDGKIQFSMKITIHLFHHQQRDVFMHYAVHQRMFQYVRKRAVSDVVHKDGSLYCLCLGIEDVDALL